MRFLNIGLEEEETPQSVDLNPDETGKAIEAVDNMESTETTKVLKLANYKEELAIILSQNKENDEGDASSSSDDSSSDTADSEGVDSESDTNPVETEDETESSEEEESSDKKPDEADSEEKTEGEVAQEDYVRKGMHKALEALVSAQEMAKYHRLLKKRSNLGGVSKPTAALIVSALEAHSYRTGYEVSVPALEGFSNYHSSKVSTKKLMIAVEGFLESVWQAIKRFFASVWKWINDLLTPKKQNNSVFNPQTKETRKESIKEVRELIEIIIDEHKNGEKNRAKDAAKNNTQTQAQKDIDRPVLAKGITNALFKTNDKGTFDEISDNIETLGQVCIAYENMVKMFETRLMVIFKEVDSGKNADIKDFIIASSIFNQLPIETKEMQTNDVLLNNFTKEIVNKKAACFFLGTTNLSVYSKLGVAKSVDFLGKQGLSFADIEVNDNNAPAIKLPEMDPNKYQKLKEIATKLEKNFAIITNLQGLLADQAKMIKDLTDGKNPKAWDNLDEAAINDLRAQIMFFANVSVSTTSGHMKLSSEVNKICNGFKLLEKTYIK